MEKNKLPNRKNEFFKVPEGYFETLEDRIMEAVTAPEEAGISGDRKDSGFKVPENYFENFEAKLFDKLENQKKTPKIISLLNKEIFYYVAGAAAVFVAVVSTLFTNPAQQTEGIEDVDIVTLESYLFETLETSGSDVSHYLSGEEAYVAPAEQNVDFEALYEYLNEHVEEPSILFNED